MKTTLEKAMNQCVNPLFHFDKNGKWGGKQAVIGHFDNQKSRTSVLYILVGDYWLVGKQIDSTSPSVWETFKLLSQAIQEGINIKMLYDAIARAIENDRILSKIK